MNNAGVVTISDGVVTSVKIGDGEIVDADISDAATIGATKIADGSVADTEFQYINSLTSNAQTQLDDLGSDISDITTLTDGNIYLGDGTNTAQEVVVSGDVSMNNAGVVTISDGVVTSLKIGDGEIVDADISDAATIDATKIADGSVADTEFQYINSLTSNAQTQLDDLGSDISDIPTLTDG